MGGYFDSVVIEIKDSLPFNEDQILGGYEAMRKWDRIHLGPQCNY